MPTATELLDLTAGIGQRQATYRFDLVEASSGRPLGELHPDMGSAPQLSHDTSRTIARTLTGIQLDVADTLSVNPLTMRVRPFMEIGGSEYALGTYVFTDELTVRSTAGRRGSLGATDLMFVVAQDSETTVSYPRGTPVGTAIATLLASVVGIDGYYVEPSATALGSPIAWPAGTNRGKILTDLCNLGSYMNPYMGNDSAIHVIRSFDPSGIPATFVFEPGGRVVNDSIVETTDIIDAPNRFIVVDNANTDSPVVGTYDVPVTAPHSASNRGFVVAATFDIQGPGIPGNAAQVAETLGRQQTLLERATMSTPPDPRHDSYDVVSYDGENWLEVAWSLSLVDGSELSHTLQRVYDVGSVIGP